MAFSVNLHADRYETITGDGGNGSVVDPGQALAAQLNVTDSNDASATLDVKIQDSLDNGVTWNDIVTFAQVTDATGADVKEIKSFNSRPYGRKLRAKWTITGDEAGSAATLTTSLTGTNNDLVYTADANGTAGNSITVRYVDPAVANASLSVSVSGSAITVNLATNGSSAITTTAAQVKTAIEAHATAAGLVNIANAGGNDGTGVVTALAATNLTGATAVVDTKYKFTVNVTAR